MEIWKDISEYDGAYQVSDLGNVRNSATMAVLKKQKNRDYDVVILYKDSVPKTVLIQNLVATEFVKNPDCYRYIRHKDGDRGNNTAENLEWSNRREYRERTAHINNPTGEKYITKTGDTYGVRVCFTVGDFEKAKFVRDKIMDIISEYV